MPDSTAAAPVAPLLKVSNISMRSGGVTALDGISFNFARGQIGDLIGPIARLGHLDYPSVESCFALNLGEKTREYFIHGPTGDVNASQHAGLLCAIS